MSSKTAIVVGRGPAGMLSTSYLLQRGYQVTVLAESDGSLGMWPGDFSFGRTTDAFQAFPIELSSAEWSQAFGELVALYRSFGVTLVLPQAQDIPHTVTAIGNMRPTFATPNWQYASSEPESLVFVGIDGLADSIVGAQAATYRRRSGCEAYEVSLSRPPGWDSSWGTIRFAAYLDGDAGASWLAATLREALRGVPSGIPVVLPQVIGLEHTEKLLTQLSEVGKRSVSEFPLLSPSIGGVRVRDRWERLLRQQGVRFVSGRVREVQPVPRALLTDGRSFEADCLLLASGGVLGGGMQVTVDGAIVDELVNREVGRMDHLDALDAHGHREIDCLGGGRVLAVGRAMGGWNPNRDHNGGAMLLATVRTALGMCEEVDR
ncbi:hypothetical protein [Ferrimicrobium sp.]|uniref:hypothetical protein n=1 Tax=Ferrimicrobium sp. TaxID=2926050 RepID=UPI00262F8784|nr:hypothetical protein [Ferrimicrobium sp.]